METRRLAFMSLQRVAEAVGSPGQFQTYLDKIQVEQRRIFEELLLVGSKLSPYVSQTCLNMFFKQTSQSEMGNGVTVGAVPPNGVVGRRVNGSSGMSGLNGKSWVEYGAIDDAIIEKMKDDEDDAVRLQGAKELNQAVKDMPDLSPLMPQMRLFLNFLDSALDERNPSAVLLVLEIHSRLTEGLRARLKPHLRTLVASVLGRCTADEPAVVRAEAMKTMR